MRRVTERTGSKRKRLWVTLAIVLAIGLGGVVIVGGPADVASAVDRVLRLPFDDDRDRDSDGLTDAVEEAGWKTEGLGTFHTDPDNADSDDDGLLDGMEAGQQVSKASVNTVVFAGVADPTSSDTDSDGIGDGDEFYNAMNPALADSDSDGLDDQDELDFGSDPTEKNVDGDTYTDKEEKDRDSDPTAYDLTSGQSIAAATAGFSFGTWDWGARRAGMSDAQLESPEYLAGEIASGFIGLGDLRDALVDAVHLDVVAVIISLIAIAPVAGDAAKAIAKMTKFAARSERARRAVWGFLRKSSFPEAIKVKVAKKLAQMGSKEMPTAFRDGPEDARKHVVYRSPTREDCPGYIGIAANFPNRKATHKSRGKCILPEVILSGLTRNEARAVEQYCIGKGGLPKNGGGLSNKIDSIDPKKYTKVDYAAILKYGEFLLAKNDAKCPLYR